MYFGKAWACPWRDVSNGCDFTNPEICVYLRSRFQWGKLRKSVLQWEKLKERRYFCCFVGGKEVKGACWFWKYPWGDKSRFSCGRIKNNLLFYGWCGGGGGFLIFKISVSWRNQILRGRLKIIETFFFCFLSFCFAYVTPPLNITGSRRHISECCASDLNEFQICISAALVQELPFSLLICSMYWVWMSYERIWMNILNRA